MAGLDIARLRKIAALTASSSDGEAVAALRKLQTLLSEAGLDFAEVVAHGATGRVAPAPVQTGNPFDDIFKAATDGFAGGFRHGRPQAEPWQSHAEPWPQARPQPRPQRPAPKRTRFVDPTDMPEGTFTANVKRVDGTESVTRNGDPMIWVNVHHETETDTTEYGVCVAFGATAEKLYKLLGDDPEGTELRLKVLSQKAPNQRPMIISAQG